MEETYSERGAAAVGKIMAAWRDLPRGAETFCHS